MAIAERDQYFDAIENRYPETPPTNLKSLDENVGDLIGKLKLAYKERTPVKLYSLNFQEREAAEVLLLTNEAIIYRDVDGNSIVQYNASNLDSIFRVLGI